MTRPIPHGTYKGYRLHRCRQQCCARAASRYAKAIRVGNAMGTWNPWGDTDRAHAHLRMLYSKGWTSKALARRTGYDALTIRRILYSPEQRKHRAIVEAVMRVRPDELPDQVPAYRLTRRLRVLARQGWSLVELSRQFGCSKEVLSRIRRAQDETTRRPIAARILRGYEELRDIASPSPGADRVRCQALSLGWLSDIEWEGLIDLPDDELRAELDRQVALLDPEDLAAARTAHRKHAERSVLIVAAASEYNRRQWAARKEHAHA